MESTSSSSSSTKALTIRSSDGVMFEVTETVASQFTVLKHMLEDCSGGEIPLTEIDGKTMSMVVSWGEKHSSEAKATRAELSKWETEFAATLDQNTLRLVLLAADFLDGAELVEFLTEAAARLIRGKTYLEMRQILNIKTDLTPEQEQEIISRNPWAFE